MTPETKQTESQLLAGEIDKLQSEIPRLKLERDTLGKIPMLPVGADPAVVAQKISSSVSANAGRLRGIDAAIATLTESLAAKKTQLTGLLQQEKKTAAWEQLKQVKGEMRLHCEKINGAVEFIESELQQLRDLEKASAGARWTIYPFPPDYPFLGLDPNLTMPHAIAGETSFGVAPRPVNMPL